MPARYYQAIRSHEHSKRRNKRLVVELILGIVFVALSLAVKPLVKRMLLSKVNLRPDSEGLTSWLDPPITTKRSYHLFNITNEKDVLIEPTESVLQVKDSPAYMYAIKTIKKNLQWSEDETQLSYGVERLITRMDEAFEPSMFNQSGTFVNLIWGIIRSSFGKKPTDAFYMMKSLSPFYDQNPIEQIEGFTSPLFERIREKMIGPNTEKYGYAFRQNGSELYNVTITTDLMKKGEMLKFASKLSTFQIESPDYYSFPVYDGLTFPPMIFDKPVIDVFNSDFCRPIRLERNGTISKFGFKELHKYNLKLIDFNNCANPQDPSTCPDVDKLDVSSCFSDALPNNTILLSKAHFYGSTNETIREMKLEGLTPNENEHDSVIYFEPNTGTPIQGIYRIQLNLNTLINPLKLSDDETEWEKTSGRGVFRLLPVFWIDQKIDVSPETIAKLQWGIAILHYSAWVPLVVALVLVLLVITVVEICARRATKY